MKKTTVVFILCIVFFELFGQTQSFDLVKYYEPVSWQKEEKENVVVYTLVDNRDKTWCQIGIYRSTASKGSIEEDIKSEWNELAARQYKIKDSMQVIATHHGDGWKVKAASGKFVFNKQDADVFLTTFSGYSRCISIMAITNSQLYIKTIENFIGSVDLKKPDAAINTNAQPPNLLANAAIAGTWIKSGSVHPSYADAASWGIGGYSKDQYNFFENGTYTFYSKSFGYSVTQLIFVKEAGTFTIIGNNITLSPASSVVESWSKKDGTDKWGRLLSSQKRALEKVTYQFTKHFFSGIQQWNLILQIPKPTSRDGAFGDNPQFTNAYFYAPVSNNNTVIDLPPGAADFPPF